MQREDVYRLIDEERQHQNDKWGTPTEHPHEVGGWVLLMEQYLDMARECWCGSRGDESALAMIRKVVALGVACLEQHGGISEAMRQRTAIQSEQPLKHDIDRATCRCRLCGKSSIGLVTVKFDNEKCPGPKEDPINPAVTHEFNENNLCSKCGLSRIYILSRSSPTSCITLAEQQREIT